MSTSKQEFILNNITEMVRAGRFTDLPKLAADLAEVYDVSMEVAPLAVGVSEPEPEINNNVHTVEDGEGVPYVHTVEDGVRVFGDAALGMFGDAAGATPETAPVAPVADAPTEPTPPSQRTHDDWGLPFSDDWHVSTRNTAKPGYFKRKPGTNEEEYAKFMQTCVTEAGDAFTGPENWATVSRLNKYLDPVQAAPTSPQVTQAETLQPQAETVGQAMHTGAVAEAPTEPTPSVEAAPAAPVGASASSEIPDATVMMQAHMSVCQALSVADPRHKAILERLDVPNFMVIPDDKKAWFVAACNHVTANVEIIKADASGEMLKTLLDSVTA